jgi:hypothetical protein
MNMKEETVPLGIYREIKLPTGSLSICLAIFFSVIFTGCLSTSRESILWNEEFNAVLDSMMQTWNGDGTWDHEMSGVCTRTFGTAFCAQVGREKGIEDLCEMAELTANLEQRVISEAARNMILKRKIDPNVFRGLPALMVTAKYMEDEEKKTLLMTLIPMMTTFLKMFRVDYSNVCGLAMLNFGLYSMKTGADEKFKVSGLACLNMLPVSSSDFDKMSSYNQALVFMAYANAYLHTGKLKCRETADYLMNLIEAKCSVLNKDGKKVLKFSRVLSPNNCLAYGILDLFEATGDSLYRDKSIQVMRYVLSHELYSNGIIYHHSTARGRASSFCSGCNFMSLINIYRINGGNLHVELKGSTGS